MVREGRFTSALKDINPGRRSGPWTVLADSESFLRSPVCLAAYERHNIALWSVPAKSPDLNPVEMFWGWVRRKLRIMDLQDLKKKRKPLSKMAYKLRVQTVFKSKKAQDVAKAIARKFRETCREVSLRDGAVSGR